MDPVSVVVGAISLVATTSALVLDTLDIYFRTLAHAINLYRLYGPSGLILLFFGSRTTWRVEAQVLGQLDDDVAMDFKKSVQDECTMISTAAAITAQIAITALSLSSLSQTHWIVRGFSVFSLTAALMAVYYATTQHRTLGRLLSASQVRAWIRGGSGVPERLRIVPSLKQILSESKRFAILGELIENNIALHPFLSMLAFSGLSDRHHLCDPEEFGAGGINAISPTQVKYSLIRQCFAPGVASVITMSAPQMLLSASLLALLLALGVYLGFVWTRDLDTDAGLYDSRNVFIMYIVGLVVCVLVYSISQLIQNEDSRSEITIIEDYLRDYLHNHPELLQRLHIQLVEADGKLVFAPAVEQDSSPEPETVDYSSGG